MKQAWMIFIAIAACVRLSAQDKIAGKMQAAWNVFTKDAQLNHALTGICLLDAKTGKILFEKNGNLGMAPASTQKIITTVATFEAFGPAFRYQTKIGYTGKVVGRKLLGDLVITGSGDPALASARYAATNEAALLSGISTVIKKAGIDTIQGNIVGTDEGFDLNPVPDGWLWGDMGNYYGAGHWAINWNENQYDLLLKTGTKENDAVIITGAAPGSVETGAIINDVKTGKAGTGDQSVIYADPFSETALFQGSLEPGKNEVSGSIPNADLLALNTIKNYLNKQQIIVTGETKNNFALYKNKEHKPTAITDLYINQSPALDSLVYWFLKKSINLYGEAFVRTIGMEKKGGGSTEKGLAWVDSFYTANGFDREALHLYDGSGLSPANRLTPYVLTQALYFAKGRSWFSYFYDALPIYNGMKLKSGTIGRVKCFAGYHTSKSGKQYIVSFIVNNYNSSAAALVNKMFTVLNVLK